MTPLKRKVSCTFKRETPLEAQERICPLKAEGQIGCKRLLGGISFNLLAFLETTSVFWICTPDTMPQSDTLVLVLHTLSRRQAMPVQTG